MTYTLKQMARDSYKSLRTHRTRARHNRWRNAAWFRPSLFTWAIITLPIKWFLYTRANQSVLGALVAGAIATQAWS